MRYLLTIAALGVIAQSSLAQVYPLWFLNQGATGCRLTVVGYANTSFYRDSAIALASRKGGENYSWQTSAHVRGGQTFWATEAGTYWMGSGIVESFDTATAAGASLNTAPADTFVGPTLVLVLLRSNDCRIGIEHMRRVSLASLLPPFWTDSLPNDNFYRYAVGVAPQYYYESSSWTEAERFARLNLARTVRSHLRSLQKVGDREGQEIRNEEVDVTLRNYEVVGRWRDVDKGIFYVLVRMPT